MDKSRIVESIVVAVDEVFSMMLDMQLERGEDYVVTTVPHPEEGVVALIGLAGAWAGTGSIACAPEFACRISSQMLMTEYAAVNDEVLDAIAEVTNMIMGNVKTRLEEILGPMGLSIPTVVYGRNFTTHTVKTDEWIVVPFLFKEYRMEVKLCMVPARAPGVRRGGVSAPALVKA
jgi:chemotaxis protein CheX